MTVVGDFSVRGGIKTVVTAEFTARADAEGSDWGLAS